MVGCGDRRSPGYGRMVAGLVGLVAVLLGGCAAREMIAPSGPPAYGPAKLTYVQIEDLARNLADTYMMMMAEGCDRVLAATEDKRVEVEALGIKAGSAQSVTIIAIGPNPIANLVDLAACATLRRQAMEEYWVPQVLGEVGEPIAVAALRGEEEIWSELGNVLTPEQIEELHREIGAWRKDHPDDWYTGTTGLRNISVERSEAVARTGAAPRSIFSLLFLDPFSSLDPAARQVEYTRQFADRAMFALQRQPLILSWQAEYLLGVAGTRSTGETVLSGFESVAESTSRFADFLDTIPGELDAQRVAAGAAIAAEREAAIEQLRQAAAEVQTGAVDEFFTRLKAEREAILRELTAEEGSIAATSADLRQTIEAGTVLSESLQGTAAALDGLAARFESPGGAPEKAAMTPEELREILESSRLTAEQLTVLAERVERVVASPELQARLDASDALLSAADTRLRGAIDYAFIRLVWLTVIAGVVAIGAGLALRFLARRAPAGA